MGLLSTATLGCAGDGPGDGRQSGSTGYDSAGIAITVNPLSAMTAAPRWLVSPDPSWTVGGDEGDSLQALFQVEDAAMVSEGRIAILTQEGIRLYDREANMLTRMGQPGEGPGEFVRAFDLIARGDSLVVFDWPQQRITVFRVDGELVDVVTIEKPLTRPRLLSVFEDGTFLMKEDVSSERTSEQATPVDRRYLVLTPTGELVETGVRHRYAEMIWLPQLRLSTIRTFGATAFSAGGPDGFWATTGDPQASYYSQSGSLQRIVRWETADRTVTEQDVEEHIERMIAGARAGSEQTVQNMLEGTPVATEFPASRGLLRSMDGRIWVEEYRPWSSTTSARWLVFDSDGLIVGSVVLPPRSTLYEAGANHVLVEVEDDLGVESVREYRIRPVE